MGQRGQRRTPPRGLRLSHAPFRSTIRRRGRRQRRESLTELSTAPSRVAHGRACRPCSSSDAKGRISDEVMRRLERDLDLEIARLGVKHASPVAPVLGRRRYVRLTHDDDPVRRAGGEQLVRVDIAEPAEEVALRLGRRSSRRRPRALRGPPAPARRRARRADARPPRLQAPLRIPCPSSDSPHLTRRCRRREARRRSRRRRGRRAHRRSSARRSRRSGRRSQASRPRRR